MLTLNNASLVYTGAAFNTGGGGVGAYRQINLNGTTGTISTGVEMAIGGQVSNGTLTKMGNGDLALSYGTGAAEVDNTNLYINVLQGTVDLDHNTLAGTYAAYGILNVAPGQRWQCRPPVVPAKATNFRSVASCRT